MILATLGIMPNDTAGMSGLTCTKCGVYHAVIADGFYRNATAKSGYHTSCKECQRAKVKQWRADNPGGWAEWRGRNKQHRRDYERAHMASRPDLREQAADATAEWRVQNPGRNQMAVKAWRQKNPGRVRANQERRQRRILLSGEHYTSGDVRRQYIVQGGCCFWCDAAVGDAFHVDHIIPLARGGDNSAANIAIACPPCNWSKHDNMPMDWCQGRRRRTA